MMLLFVIYDFIVWKCFVSKPCFKLSFNTSYWSSYLAIAFSLKLILPTPNHYTPSQLYDVSGHTMYLTFMELCVCSFVVLIRSDGWDRTSQLTSLSQLLLDPYYR